MEQHRPTQTGHVTATLMEQRRAIQIAYVKDILTELRRTTQIAVYSYTNRATQVNPNWLSHGYTHGTTEDNPTGNVTDTLMGQHVGQHQFYKEGRSYSSRGGYETCYVGFI
jgi:hypothetical protein